MIDYLYKDLYLEDSVDKQLHIYYDESGEITNDDLYAQEFTLKESICSETQLKFGACEASSIEFKIANSGVSLKGKTIRVEQVIGGHDELPMQIGTYIIDSDKPTADRYGRVIKAYDDMYTILNTDLTTWWGELPNTFTVRYLRDALASYFNLTQQTINLVNDGLTINKPTLKSVSGKDVITAICEINACFGHIGRDRTLNYLFLREVIEGLYPANDLYPEDDLYPREERIGQIINKQHYMMAQYEDYMTHQITKINVYDSENTLKASQGTGTNIYNISENILVDGMTAQTAQAMVANVYSDIATVWYMPCTLECVGTPCIEVGDSIRLNTTDKIIYTYVLERTLKGIQALVDNIEAQGEEYRTDDMNSLASQVNRISAQSELNASGLDMANIAIDGVSGRVGTIEANYVRVSQLEAVSARVGYLEADHVSVGSLDAVSVRVGNLEADHVSVASFNALSGTVRNLSANVITTDYLASHTIRVGNLYSNGTVQAPNGAIIGSTGNFDKLVVAGRTYYLMTRTINGVTIRFLGTTA